MKKNQTLYELGIYNIGFVSGALAWANEFPWALVIGAASGLVWIVWDRITGSRK